MLFALDAMGGDLAPKEPCRGAVLACKENPSLRIALVGREGEIVPHLSEAEPAVRAQISVVHAEEMIGMGDNPTSIRTKKNSSLRVCMEMVRSGEAEGCISAGNTGAIVAGGVLVVGRIQGIDRPGLGVPLPAFERTSLLLDIGATIRCKPINLYQFARMGAVYLRSLTGIENPSIALLANGEEDIKGDEACAGAREMLIDSNLNFRGYVEGKDIPHGKTDVVVCDGYTGNALIKFGEGIGEIVYNLVKQELANSVLAKLGVALMWPALKRIGSRFDYEKQGGSPLLGVDGVVIKAHGRSKGEAISNALRVGVNFARNKGTEIIRNEISGGI